jgi:hypothetical protein
MLRDDASAAVFRHASARRPESILEQGVMIRHVGPGRAAGAFT